MDLTAEFYLQTVDRVFIHHEVPLGLLRHRGELIDLKAIRRTALLHRRRREGRHFRRRPDLRRAGSLRQHSAGAQAHYLQEGVGHYGVFNGSRFRRDIAPRIVDFTHQVERLEA